ncbi:hypothetical protein E5CHR_01316 [Variovorax sp. PBL-E5]|nr:hypothetical protein E5CHR_01316 [Variovorax sp. PBL-E5]
MRTVLVDHLDRGAALAAKDRRAEHDVDAGADNEFLRMGPVHRGLHGEAVDSCQRPGGSHRIEHLARGTGQRNFIVEPEPRVTHVRLVGDVARQDLECHWIAEPARGFGSRLGQRRDGQRGYLPVLNAVIAVFDARRNLPDSRARVRTALTAFYQALEDDGALYVAAQ